MKRVWREGIGIPKELEISNIRKEISELRSHYEMEPSQRLQTRPSLNAKVWLSDGVFEALMELFNEKCAYCETKIESRRHDIHHHRPLMNAKNLSGANKKSSADHYSWYAYEWNNLVPTCLICSRFKAGIFPTNKERVQAWHPWNEAGVEEPLLLDPCVDEPGQHLEFRETGRCRGISERGRATIQTLKLNRSELVSRRKQSFLILISTLDAMRGRDYEQVRFHLKSILNPDVSHFGASKIWIEKNLPGWRDSEKPIPDGELISELAGFVAISNDAEWQDFYSRLIGNKPLVYEEDLIEASPLPEIGLEKDKYSRVISIEINNFKGISNLKMEFNGAGGKSLGVAPAAVLLGENSVGKSSILQAIAIAAMEVNLHKRLNSDLSEFRNKDSLSSSSLEREDAETFILIRFESGRSNRVRINRDGTLEIGEYTQGLVLAYGASRSFRSEDTSPQRILKHASVRSLYDRNMQIPHSLQWLESLEDDEFEVVARAMREILSLKKEDHLYRTLSREVRVRGYMGDRAVTQLSDGYRSLFAIGLDIIRNMMREWGNLEDAHGIVLIDEIELHLHPRWKMQIVNSLRKALPQVQFIFTTHDPLCLRGVLDGEVHVLVKDEEHQTVELAGLPNVQAMRAEQILTSEYFGLASTSDIANILELDRAALSDSPVLPKTENLNQRLSAFSMIGDTPEEQVFNEALRLHIIESLNSKELDRKKVRVDAVSIILDRLRNRK